MIYVCEHHDQVLTCWREQDLRDIRLVHVDFHDDLRGLLVDRRRGRAYPVGALARSGSPVDAGNFLAHAVLEGRLSELRWLHGSPGGRAWDAGIVRYESDLSAWRHRLAHALAGGPERPLAFEEVLLDRWTGLRPGERLSVDWDCFASILQDPQGVASRVEAFLARLGDQRPPDVYLAYSPEYSHPTLAGFLALVQELAQRFRQGVLWLSPGLEVGRFQPSGIDARLPRGPVMRLVLMLRRRGIY